MVVISIVRIIYVYNYISNPDVTYYQAEACIFSTAELNGGVICACIALLKPFIQKYMPWILSLSNRNGSRSWSRRFARFGKRSGDNSYELRSAEADSHEQRDSEKLGGAIAVRHKFSDQSTASERNKGDSTDDLFVPSSLG